MEVGARSISKTVVRGSMFNAERMAAATSMGGIAKVSAGNFLPAAVKNSDATKSG